MFSHTPALRWCRRGTNLHLQSAQLRVAAQIVHVRSYAHA